MTLLQFSTDGTFQKKYDFALTSDKVLKIVCTLIGAMERDEYMTHVSQRILASMDIEDDSEAAFDIVSGDES